MEVCEFISKYPLRANNLGSNNGKKLNAEVVLRDAIESYPLEHGKLWIFLADYHTRIGNF